VPGMAFRTRAKLSGIAVGAAALAAAGQLGLAYGLGILHLSRVLDITARDQWIAQLAWVAWITMTSAAAGGMAARVHLPRRSGAGTRIVGAVLAGIGAAAVIPLTMQPARSAQVDGVRPVFVIGVCAALSAIVGIVAAYATLSRAVARWNIATIGIAIWVVAVASVAGSFAPGKPSTPARLGVFDASFLDGSVIDKTALFTMPALALVCGLIIGLVARGRGLSTLSIALSGLAGPALLTLAYLVAGPGSGPDRYQTVPYWAAMTASGAGVLGSVLAAILRRSPGAETATTTPRPGNSPTPEPPPLPKRDAQPDSAIAQAASVAAQRPPEELRPSDTGVMSVPPFDGFTPARNRPEPQPVSPPLPNPRPTGPPPTAPPPVGHARVAPPQVRGGGRPAQDGEFVDWVSGLGQ
jgi:hypothetical protein